MSKTGSANLDRLLRLVIDQLQFSQTWVASYHGVARRARGERKTATLLQKDIPGVMKVELVVHLYGDTTPTEARRMLLGEDDD
jgi:hypothetical protein